MTQNCEIHWHILNESSCSLFKYNFFFLSFYWTSWWINKCSNSPGKQPTSEQTEYLESHRKRQPTFSFETEGEKRNGLTITQGRASTDWDVTVSSNKFVLGTRGKVSYVSSVLCFGWSYRIVDIMVIQKRC